MIALHRILHRRCDSDIAWWRSERARVEGERDAALADVEVLKAAVTEALACIDTGVDAKARCDELHGDLLRRNIALAHRAEQAEAARDEALGRPARARDEQPAREHE